MPSRPIFLLTDFGADGFYVGVMKAVIAAGSPASRVADLDHEIPAHDVAAASFVLARSFEYLPVDAVVVVVVDPGVGSARHGLILTVDGRVLVGPDNGFASDLMLSGAEVDVVAIDDGAARRVIGIDARGTTFHGRDVFGPIAAAIARGAGPSEFGARGGGVVMRADVPSVSIDGGRVHGTGRYVDRFGNILTDIPESVLRRVFGAAGSVRVTVAGRDLGPLRHTYVDGPPGELIALVNSWGLVEAAVNGGRAIDRFEHRAPRDIPFQINSG